MLLSLIAVFEKNGYKIGVFALTTRQTLQSTDNRLLLGIKFKDEIASAKEILDRLRPLNLDAVILLAHLGCDDAPCTSEELAQALTGKYQDELDLIIDGHSHQEYVKKVKDYASQENAQVVSLCAKVEEDLSELTKEEKDEMLEALGLDESGLDKLIQATYDILGLATYFTVGKDEVRAWTFRKGMNAKQCAGIIHTDFEKGFIRAEVTSYNDLIECGSELKVKEAGRARLEGKDYIMQDGDICHFRFNV